VVTGDVVATGTDVVAAGLRTGVENGTNVGATGVFESSPHAASSTAAPPPAKKAMIIRNFNKYSTQVLDGLGESPPGL
jgi:hypothetical protein